MPVSIHVSKTKVRSGFDPFIAKTQLLALQVMADTWGIPTLCRNYLMILAKRELYKHVQTRLVEFDLSRIQLDLQNMAGKRNITLKPRQIGSTTWHIICRLLVPAITKPGTSGLLISQTKGYGAQHFRILQRALKNFGRTPSFLTNSGLSAQQCKKIAEEYANNLLHTQYSARHEIVFDFLDSKVLVDTAENPDAGTGLTINHLVATEVAYWMRSPEALLAQAKEAIPAGGTMDIETTPNGMGGYFFEEWMRAKDQGSEFTPHFYPWWWQDEYQADKEAEEPLTEQEEKMSKEFAWTMKQIQWRRSKIQSLRGKFPEKYPEDATTCFLTSGDLFFDKDMLSWIKLNVIGKKPLESFHEGTLKIYKRRIKGRRYLIGADAAEGKLAATENSDSNSACVMDIDTGEEVAAYRSKLPPEEFSQDLLDLAHIYNDALICPERNGPGQSVILTLSRHLLYGNIYMHREWHRERKMVIPVMGFPTTLRTRPIALNKLAAMYRDAPELWHDEAAIDQALTFVWTSTNKTTIGGPRKPSAAQGCHDDDISARWVAAYCRLVALGYLDPVETPSEKYGDLGEDEEQAA
jgi:hypothetical protein